MRDQTPQERLEEILQKMQTFEHNPPGRPLPCIIVLSGPPGAGTSTLRAALAQFLRFKEFYAGGIMREMAAKRGLTIDAFYEKIKDEPHIEFELDQQQAAIIRTETYAVVEGRMAPFLAPEVWRIRVLVTADSKERAKRQMGRPEYKGLSISEIEAIAAARVAMEQARYYDRYNIRNHLDPTCFDIVIDNTDLTEKETLAKTLSLFREFIKRNATAFLNQPPR